MRNKWIQLAALCTAVLAVLYAVSLGIYLYYQTTIKTEIQKARDLPSTDLSRLSFNDLTVGKVIGDIPYYENVPEMYLSLDEGEFWLPYLNGETINSKLTKIRANIYSGNAIIAYYNGETIPDLARLTDYLGEDYIDVSLRGRRRVYIDHENNLKLTLTARDDPNDYRSVEFEQLASSGYEDFVPEHNTGIEGILTMRIMVLNPIWVSMAVKQRLDSGYSIFKSNEASFSNLELLILPLYYWLHLLPVIAMCIFRSERLLKSNAALVGIHVVSLIGMFLCAIFTTRV